MGNVTVSITERSVAGNRRYVSGTITMSSSYATSGDSYTVNMFESSQVIKLQLNSRSAHYAFRPDLSNRKIIAYEDVLTGGTTSAADSTTGALATDPTGTEIDVRLMGSSTGAIYRLGSSAEVSSARDLSAEVIDFEAIILC